VRELFEDTSDFLVASDSKFTLPSLLDGNLQSGSFRVPSPLMSVVSCILRLAATNPLLQSICLVGEAEWNGKVAESGMANGNGLRGNV
jgi:glyceraldehyde-3-phosphate dehydrogenase/erythrose-4-phosphate dehydrogenase